MFVCGVFRSYTVNLVECSVYYKVRGDFEVIGHEVLYQLLGVVILCAVRNATKNEIVSHAA